MKNTDCIHAGYSPKNGESRQIPIIQSTTFKYESTEFMGKLFDLQENGYFYSRLANPTCDMVAARIAKLEGGAGAVLTSSGQAAIFFAIVNICEAGDHIVCTNEVYGGTYNLINTTLKRFGISSTFISVNSTEDEIKNAVKENTKLIFAETLSNPSLCVLDIERFAKVAHECGLPLVVDNTFATPINCNPIKWGADIVVHSATKYLDGHSSVVAGAIVDSGNFDWSKYPQRFKGLCEPDDSYHGLVFTKAFGNIAYLVRVIVWLMRDIGACLSAHSAYLLGMNIESLPLRVEKHCKNAKALSKHLLSLREVKSVNCPMLEDNKYYNLAQKYMPNGTCGVISFELNATKEQAVKFLDSLELISISTHVADAKSCILHPVSHTHRQLNKEELVKAGVSEGLIRLSIGIEDENDLINDINQALKKAFN